jgi:mannose-6-phosphate isomerase-like protein (cupin superfamily)
VSASKKINEEIVVRASGAGRHPYQIFRSEAVPWLMPEGHTNSYSKMLVSPERQGSQRFDFRISSYPVSGSAAAHVHDVAEQIYYFLEGTGLVEIDGVEHIVEPHTTMYVAPGVRHSVANTGFTNLVFIVATSPPEGISRPEEG